MKAKQINEALLPKRYWISIDEFPGLENAWYAEDDLDPKKGFKIIDYYKLNVNPDNIFKYRMLIKRDEKI